MTALCLGEQKMKLKEKNYLAKFSDDIRELIEEVKSASEKHGSADYEQCGRLMETAVESDSNVLIGIAYYHLAQYCLSEGAKNDSKMNLLGCLNYLHGKGPFEYIARAYYLMGEIEKSQNNMVTAVEYYENGISCCDENDQPEIKAILLNGVGSCYYELEQTNEAFRYYQRAMKIYQKLKKTQNIEKRENAITSLIGMAECKLQLEQIEEAQKWKEKLVNLLENEKEIHWSKSEIFLFYSLFYWKMGDCEKAEKYIDKADHEIEKECYKGKHDRVVKYIRLLIKINDYDRLEKSLAQLFPYVEKSEDCDLKMYFLCTSMQYVSAKMQEEELRRCADQYFRLLAEDVQDKGSSVIRNLEARKQLRQLQEKQQELKVMNQQLLNNSLHDALTGLPNRGYLNEHSEKIFDRAYSKECACGICLLDIDFFKQLNDRYGHLEGDRCLKMIGSTLAELRNSRVFCARYGGDEFTIVIYNLSQQEIEDMLENLQSKIKKLHIPNKDSEVEPYVTISMGCFTAIPTKGDKLWDYFSRADAALYRAKYLGKDKVVVWGKAESLQHHQETERKS